MRILIVFSVTLPLILTLKYVVLTIGLLGDGVFSLLYAVYWTIEMLIMIQLCCISSVAVTFATLGEKTTVMSPQVLINAGVPCCR